MTFSACLWHLDKHMPVQWSPNTGRGDRHRDDTKGPENKPVGMFDFHGSWTDMRFVIFMAQSQTVTMLFN